MPLEKVKYQNSLASDWDMFISNSINGNFLHKRSFYDSNEANTTDDHSLLFYKKNKIVAVCPAVLMKNGDKIVLNSHLRSTYGGIIINSEVGVVEALDIVGQIVQDATENNVSEIVIRNPFRIFYQRISDEIDYALWFHNFEIKSREAEVYVDLSPIKEEIKKRYENGSKYNIKKAWKFVTVSLSEDFELFWDILEANLAEKHAKSPVHSLKDIYLLRENAGKENIKLFSAFHEGKMAAGCVIFVIRDSLHAQYIGQDSNFQEFRPVNAVLDYIIDWGKENGFKNFNLGTANEGGKVINEGLFHFKEGFGGRSVLRETMSLNLKQL